MRIPTSCSMCNKDATPENYVINYVELRDDNMYHIKCECGNEYVLGLQERRFELLFEFGVLSIVDGYYREAVVNFASCLERFYEFYITVISLKRGIEYTDFLDVWKNLKNQSERQLGAFIMTYTFETGNQAKLLARKNVELRNKVVHKGYFPSKSEAIKFGQNALNIINEMLMQLFEDYNEYIDQEYFEARKYQFKDMSSRIVEIVGVSLPLSISLSRPTLIGTKTLQEMVDFRSSFNLIQK